MIEYFYFRDHPRGAWGVKKGETGFAGGEIVLRDLNLYTAAAICHILNGKFQDAEALLQSMTMARTP